MALYGGNILTAAGRKRRDVGDEEEGEFDTDKHEFDTQKHEFDTDKHV